MYCCPIAAPHWRSVKEKRMGLIPPLGLCQIVEFLLLICFKIMIIPLKFEFLQHGKPESRNSWLNIIGTEHINSVAFFDQYNKC